jgi:hypothetical protein
MSTIHSQDRASLCTFTFADGRRCSTPRQSGHPQFCCFHARKQAQHEAAGQLGRDFTFLLSGDFFSACDLAAALGRLFAAVARGDVKPRAAATLAYLAQTLLQTIQAAEHEYCQAFGPDAWRHTVYAHVKQNQKYLSPAPAQPPSQPAPQPANAPAPQPPPSVVVACHQTGSSSAPASVAPSAVVAGLQTGSSAPKPSAVEAARNSPRAGTSSAPASVAPSVVEAGPQTGSSSPSATAVPSAVVAGLQTGSSAPKPSAVDAGRNSPLPGRETGSSSAPAGVAPSAVVAGLETGSSSASATAVPSVVVAGLETGSSSPKPSAVVAGIQTGSSSASAGVAPSAVDPAPNSSRPGSSSALKTPGTPTGQTEPANVATGPSGLTLLAPLPAPRSQTPSGSDSA